jgi:hypothetical protein
VSFSGSYQKKNILLSWKVLGNETVDHFALERSLDGSHFTPCGTVAGTLKAGNEVYQFSEPWAGEKAFYRFKVVDKKGLFQYSNTIQIHEGKPNLSQLAALENPVREDLTLSYATEKSTPVDFRVYNFMGAIIYSAKINCIKGQNLITVPESSLKQKGVYYVDVLESASKRLSARVVRL